MAGRGVDGKDDGFDIPGIGHVAAMRPNQLPGGGFTIAPVAVLDAAARADFYLLGQGTYPEGAVFPVHGDAPAGVRARWA